MARQLDRSLSLCVTVLQTRFCEQYILNHTGLSTYFYDNLLGTSQSAAILAPDARRWYDPAWSEAFWRRYTVEDKTEYICNDDANNASPRAQVSDVFRRGMYAIFPWHDPKDYPGCVNGLSEAIGMKRNTVRANAYKRDVGPSANACETLSAYIKQRIGILQQIAWELDQRAETQRAKTAARPGLRAIHAKRQKIAQSQK